MNRSFRGHLGRSHLALGLNLIMLAKVYVRAIRLLLLNKDKQNFVSLLGLVVIKRLKLFLGYLRKNRDLRFWGLLLLRGLDMCKDGLRDI